MIWVAPQVTQPGGVCSAPVDFMSIYPTLCDLASIPLPTHVEGKSLRSFLASPTSAWDSVALTTYGKDNHAVRDARWRYIRYADGSEELYDHDTDPYEWKNLAGDPAHSDVKQRLAGHFPTMNVDPVKTRQQRDGAKEKGKKRANRNKKSDRE